jgi:aryl-alcohol dehydrogenase-like predicted oxidoreductase
MVGVMIERAEFGRTGHLSSRVIFGAAALSQLTQEQADPLLDVLLEFGVNHWDTAASYGVSEDGLKPWLATHRDEIFLATKTGDRTAGEARASLERSLQRMGVDHVDLIQLHNLVEEDEWQVVHGPGGALEALVQARSEGLTRFIGVTGHGVRVPAMHARSLERFDYDSVLLPYNFVQLEDAQYRADVEHLLGVCAERRVAVQTIKAVARRRWSEEATGTRLSWYEPLPPGEALERAVRFVLGRQQLFLDSSSEPSLLRAILTAASTPGRPPSDDELRADIAAEAMQALFDGSDLERI